jgi:hypothetical protein
MIYNFTFWIGSVTFHIFITNLVYKKGLSIGLEKQKPLYDIIQQNCVNLRRWRILPEIFHFIPILLLGCCWLYNLFENIQISNDALEIFFSKHGTLFYLRPLLFSSTLLPDSSQNCIQNRSLGSCFDLIFSGHASIMYLCTYILRDIFKIGALLYYTLQFNNIFTSFLIIICRNHYTVDVLLAIIITHFVYFYGSEFKILF